jgi:hypothetical protein
MLLREARRTIAMRPPVARILELKRRRENMCGL